MIKKITTTQVYKIKKDWFSFDCETREEKELPQEIISIEQLIEYMNSKGYFLSCSDIEGYAKYYYFTKIEM